MLPQILIRISLLLVMVVLGLIIVFPQVLDLKDMMYADLKKSWTGRKKSTSPQLPGGGIKNFFKSNVAPSSGEVKEFLMNSMGVMKVTCLGKMPKIIYDSEKNIITPSSPSVSYQIIKQNQVAQTIESGRVFLIPQLYSKYHSWLFRDLRDWLDPNRLEGWTYKSKSDSINRHLVSQSFFTKYFGGTEECVFN